MAFVEAAALCKSYRLGRKQAVHALRGVDLSIEEGEFVALLGHSGSGKSTLLNLIGGLDRPTSGRLRVAQADLGALGPTELALYRRRTVGFVFQSFHLSPRLPAWENVALPLRFAGRARAERRRRAHAVLEQVGLAQRADHRPSELSGGEQQRVAVARGLIQQPRLLLTDEPTGNLDTATGRQILDLLSEVHRGGTTLLMVTHDADMAQERAGRIVRLADGRLLHAPAGRAEPA